MLIAEPQHPYGTTSLWAPISLRVWIGGNYLNQKVQLSHLGAHEHNRQYDGRPDGRHGVWAGMRNVGSVSGKEGGERRRTEKEDE